MAEKSVYLVTNSALMLPFAEHPRQGSSKLPSRNSKPRKAAESKFDAIRAVVAEIAYCRSMLWQNGVVLSDCDDCLTFRRGSWHVGLHNHGRRVGVAVAAQVRAGVVLADVLANDTAAGFALPLVFQMIVIKSDDGQERRIMGRINAKGVQQFAVVLGNSQQQIAIDASIVSYAIR